MATPSAPAPGARPPFDPFTRTTIKTQLAPHGDVYHRAVRMSWPRFLALLAGCFVLVNVLFGLLYMAGPNTIEGARADSFADHFFLSLIHI